jgi:hypothetical protein
MSKGTKMDMMDAMNTMDSTNPTIETAIKARPFICTAEEVRGILGGEAVQIWRPIFPKHIAWAKGCGPKDFDTIGSFRPNRQGVLSAWLANYPGVSVGEVACPHGRPGDQLWVREVWQVYHDAGNGSWSVLRPTAATDRDGRILYRATTNEPDPNESGRLIWRPSSHMPRWAARIVLEITAVASERQQDTGPWMWAIECKRLSP